MIEQFFLDDWRQQVPWVRISQIEQDLIISRALVDLYNDDKISTSLVFRGGTALNKLYINPPSRYSEDIDLVQVRPEPIGKTLDAIRKALDWLGKQNSKLTERSAKMLYKYSAIDGTPMKLRVEINTTEHISFLDLAIYEFGVSSGWYSEKAKIKTYHLDELMGTKLRALFQRRKGRDLFDLWIVLKDQLIDPQVVRSIFLSHCKEEGLMMSRAIFEKNIYEKLQNKEFGQDMEPLLANSQENWFSDAYTLVSRELIAKLPGDPWQKK